MKASLAILAALVVALVVAGCATNVSERKRLEVQRITNTGYYTYQATTSARHR